MKECYHKPCDNSEEMPYNLEFIEKIIQSTAWTVSDFAEGRCGSKRKISVQGYFESNASKRVKNGNISLLMITEFLKVLSNMEESFYF